MDNKDVKPKKAKKDSIEIRFTISENDGNLKEMIGKVPGGCYTDFTKQALRYYLKAVRDGEVECDFLKPHALDEFKVGLKPQEPSFEDVLRVIQACGGVATGATVATPVVNTITSHPVVEENSLIYTPEEFVDDVEDDEDNEDNNDMDYDIHINIDEEDNKEDGAIKEESTLNHATFNF